MPATPHCTSPSRSAMSVIEVLLAAGANPNAVDKLSGTTRQAALRVRGPGPNAGTQERVQGISVQTLPNEDEPISRLSPPLILFERDPLAAEVKDLSLRESA